LSGNYIAFKYSTSYIVIHLISYHYRTYTLEYDLIIRIFSVPEVTTSVLPTLYYDLRCTTTTTYYFYFYYYLVLVPVPTY